MMIKIFDIPRARDEMVLRWLHLRQRGYTSWQIAQTGEAQHGAISTATNRVRQADLKESGECPRLVQKGYI